MAGQNEVIEKAESFLANVRGNCVEAQRNADEGKFARADKFIGRAKAGLDGLMLHALAYTKANPDSETLDNVGAYLRNAGNTLDASRIYVEVRRKRRARKR